MDPRIVGDLISPEGLVIQARSSWGERIVAQCVAAAVVDAPGGTDNTRPPFRPRPRPHTIRATPPQHLAPHAMRAPRPKA